MLQKLVSFLRAHHIQNLSLIVRVDRVGETHCLVADFPFRRVRTAGDREVRQHPSTAAQMAAGVVVVAETL
nr:hypothetical protein [Streptomyces sp. DSM 41633]